MTPAPPVRVRYEWPYARRGVELIERYGRQYLAPRGERTARPWCPADADELIAALPGEIAGLGWPISIEDLRKLSNKYGLLLVDADDMDEARTFMAASLLGLRAAVFEIQTAIRLRAALEIHGRSWSKLIERDRYRWRLCPEVPEGLEGFDLHARIGSEADYRDREGKSSALPPDNGTGLREAGRQFLDALTRAASDRWVKLDPSTFDITIRSPIGACWYELSHPPQPALFCCRYCDRPFPRNRRWKQGESVYCSDRHKQAAYRERREAKKRTGKVRERS